MAPASAIPAATLSAQSGSSAPIASSLLRRQPVVTTRLAQNCCRFARTALQQGSHWLAPLRLVGVKMPRVCHTRHAWRRRLWSDTVVAAWGSGAGLHPTRMLAKPDCDRAAFALDCGRTVAGARYQVLSKRLTTGLQVSPSLAAAGVEEISPALALDLASIGRCVYGHQAG